MLVGEIVLQMKLAESDFAKNSDDIHRGYSLCTKTVNYNHTQGGVVEKCKNNLLEKL